MGFRVVALLFAWIGAACAATQPCVCPEPVCSPCTANASFTPNAVAQLLPQQIGGRAKTMQMVFEGSETLGDLMKSVPKLGQCDATSAVMAGYGGEIKLVILELEASSMGCLGVAEDHPIAGTILSLGGTVIISNAGGTMAFVRSRVIVGLGGDILNEVRALLSALGVPPEPRVEISESGEEA